jgi:hypothetical protein
MAPKIMILKGKISHWKNIAIVFVKPYFAGFFGKSKLERIADKTKPDMAAVISVLVINGKLADKTVSLNLSPPKIIGIQPITPIISALVAHE